VKRARIKHNAIKTYRSQVRREEKEETCKRTFPAMEILLQKFGNAVKLFLSQLFLFFII